MSKTAVRPAPASTPAARASWVLFDWATQPYFTLVTSFLFVPYFAAHFIGDPVRGQALWGQAQGSAGFIVALSAPLLGAIADETGRRKIWVALFSLFLVAGSFMLWFAVPGQLPVAAVMGLLVVSIVGVEFATAFTNAMLPELARPGHLGHLSGTGWATGYFGGIAGLVLVIGVLAPADGSAATLLGVEPLLALAGDHVAARLTGPFAALWYALFVLPLFIFVAEPARARMPVAAAARSGLSKLVATLRQLSRYRNVAVFLLARMAYIDGLTALFAFAGLYAAGEFGWGSTALGLYGVIISVFAGLGALAGGPLDDRLGPKRVCSAAIMVLLVCVLAVGSLEGDRVFFLISVAPADPAALFASWPERLFLMFSAVVGIFAGPLQASSRSLMARISPPDRMTAFFGLYALSGKATAFAAPLTIALITTVTGSQRFGLLVILAFLGAGLAILALVDEEQKAT